MKKSAKIEYKFTFKKRFWFILVHFLVHPGTRIATNHSDPQNPEDNFAQQF